MTQVSRRPLEKEIQERIFEVFWQTVVNVRNPRQAQDFFDDFLSPTEKIMLAKRLSIALMLLKGFDYKSIEDTLKVSSTTIKAVNLWIKHGGKGGKSLLQKIIKSEKIEEFWDKIEKTIEEILPPRSGTNWRRIRSEQFARRKEERYKRHML